MQFFKDNHSNVAHGLQRFPVDRGEYRGISFVPRARRVNKNGAFLGDQVRPAGPGPLSGPADPVLEDASLQGLFMDKPLLLAVARSVKEVKQNKDHGY
jgi:hypothetical protein